MSLLVPLLLAPWEMRLELPASKELWQAKTASEWRDLFLAQDSQQLLRLPSLDECIRDSGLILPVKTRIDFHLSSLAVLSTYWSRISAYRQDVQQRSGGVSRNPLLTNAVYRDVKDVQESFKMIFNESWEHLGPTASMLYEHQFLFLHFSLEDVQSLAGKLGETEARRMIPILVEWVKSEDSRQAIWHAGQMLRAANLYTDILPAQSLVAIYHASVVLWAYSQILSINNSARVAGSASVQDDPTATVPLNGRGDAWQFIKLGKGTPVISVHCNLGEQGIMKQVPVSDGRAVMTSIVDSLLSKNGVTSSGQCQPLVAQLGRMMLELGHAAGRLSQHPLT